MIRFLGLLLLLNSFHVYADMVWAEGECSKQTGFKDGAGRDFYNGAAALKWESKDLEFSDADGLKNGVRAFAENSLLSDKGPKWNEWDVSTLVKSWLNGKYPNQGFLIKRTSGGTQHFDSSEAEDENFRPYLEFTLKDKVIRFAIEADTSISASTYKCSGSSKTLGGNGAILLYTDLHHIDSELISARLFLHSQPKRYGSKPFYGIYRVNINQKFSPITQEFEITRGDPDKYFYQQNFENSDWLRHLNKGSGYQSMRRVLKNDQEGFVPISGFALEAKIPKGKNTGMSLSYFFKKRLGFEPEEAYLKYDLRLGKGWETVQGGKLPGLAGTYGTAGWGGRRADGTNGWSARGIFKNIVPSRNPLAGLVPIGSYLYHADMPSLYGNSIVWNQNSESMGMLQRNRWYSLEQRVKLNTLGKKNGILEAWIDGEKVYSNHSVNFRTVDRLKIERAWFNIFHGGTATVKKDIYAFVDNIVISPEYIGTSPSH